MTYISLNNLFIMKTPRYKFDLEWEKAIDYMAWFDINTQYVKDLIRKYIETGYDPTDEFIQLPVMGVWMLIKAQIDQRKARNERARQRRRQRREEKERLRLEMMENGHDGITQSDGDMPVTSTADRTYLAAEASEDAAPPVEEVASVPDEAAFAGALPKAAPITCGSIPALFGMPEGYTVSVENAHPGSPDVLGGTI